MIPLKKNKTTQKHPNKTKKNNKNKKKKKSLQTCD